MDAKLEILRMVESGQVTAEQAADLLSALEAAEPDQTTLPGATVAEEAWMLTALLQVTEAISSPEVVQDPSEMLGRVARIVPLLAGVDRCGVYVWEDGRHAHCPAATYPGRLAPQQEDQTIDGALLPLLDSAREQGGPIVLSLGADGDQQGGTVTRALLPMITQGKYVGSLVVDYLGRREELSEKETTILANIAHQTAVGIENMRLREAAVAQARLERDLQLARDLQASLLPKQAPTLPGWDIAGYWRAARSVGGDFYDFVSLGNGRLGLIIADVSDKGMAAALFMALARSVVRACAERRRSAARALLRANRLICADAHEGMFVTLFYAILDAQRQRLLYSNAGHNPPLLFGAGREIVLEGRGIALGVVERPALEERTVLVNSGDVVVMYTDGLTEAVNERDEQFGVERLCHVVRRNVHLPAAALIDRIVQAVGDFTGSLPQFDDATILIAKYI